MTYAEYAAALLENAAWEVRQAERISRQADGTEKEAEMYFYFQQAERDYSATEQEVADFLRDQDRAPGA